VNIKDIEDALKNEQESPPDLAKYATILAGYYFYYANMMKKILLNKDSVCLTIQDAPIQKGDKALSDKKTERIWNTTKEGQAEIALEWEYFAILRMILFKKVHKLIHLLATSDKKVE
jgi:hypothetical protein